MTVKYVARVAVTVGPPEDRPRARVLSVRVTVTESPPFRNHTSASSYLTTISSGWRARS